MQFYLATSMLLPRALRLRLLFLCICATHLPLLCYIGWGVTTGRFAWAEYMVLMLASMIALIGALTGMGALLDTLHHPEGRKQAWPNIILDPVAKLGGRIAALWHAARPLWARRPQQPTSRQEDMLTGLPNRNGFLAQLEALPPERRQGCMAIIDIDHFGEINDLLGRETGDDILRDFACRLSSQIRRADLIGRWDGGAFAIFCHDCIEDEASWSLARISERMRQTPVARIHGQPISFSAGLASRRGRPVATAIAEAEEALTRAKRAGRDQVQRAGRPAQPAYL